MQWPPCDRHGIMMKFSNCEEGKLSMVKLSRFSKIRENRESFDVYGIYMCVCVRDKVQQYQQQHEASTGNR